MLLPLDNRLSESAANPGRTQDLGRSRMSD